MSELFPLVIFLILVIILLTIYGNDFSKLFNGFYRPHRYSRLIELERFDEDISQPFIISPPFIHYDPPPPYVGPETRISIPD